MTKPSEDSAPRVTIAEPTPATVTPSSRVSLVSSVLTLTETDTLVRPTPPNATGRDLDQSMPSVVPASGAGLLKALMPPFLGGLVFVVAAAA